jgi:hypothetical protein
MPMRRPRTATRRIAAHEMPATSIRYIDPNRRLSLAAPPGFCHRNERCGIKVSMTDDRMLLQETRSMTRIKWILTAFSVLGLLAVWHAFRPERLWLNQVVHELAPSSNDLPIVVVSQGTFHGVAHESRGSAAILKMPSGARVLRFTDFETSNGPDLRVLLVAAEDANDSASIRQTKSIELGSLKGNIGEQNYDLPATIDLDQFRAVTIWCHRFNVNFATAPLNRQIAQR